MDTDEDMRLQREELRRAEKQERLLRLRDRDNALVAQVLRGMIAAEVGQISHSDSTGII